MSVAMTNCGPVGWVSDRSGYRYSSRDPLTDQDWPPMPREFVRLALDAASAVRLSGFRARRLPHQPLFSRARGSPRIAMPTSRTSRSPSSRCRWDLPASFAFYGLTRGGKGKTVALADGDVLVWGGPSRLVYHAVRPIKPGTHPLTGGFRYNLTFRHAR